ncbi:MAG TPA: hypothetical protein VL125_05365 [Pelobium sp.]|nr:hypothetical protein [Pelobium sp.]
MKRIKIYKRCLLTILLLTVANVATFACEACNQNQPKILRNITHGGGPESIWDYFVVITMVFITIYTLYATIRCFIRPKETKYNRIKNEILTPQ